MLLANYMPNELRSTWTYFLLVRLILDHGFFIICHKYLAGKLALAVKKYIFGISKIIITFFGEWLTNYNHYACVIYSQYTFDGVSDNAYTQAI